MMFRDAVPLAPDVWFGPTHPPRFLGGYVVSAQALRAKALSNRVLETGA